jgi:hypothetical protein
MEKGLFHTSDVSYVKPLSKDYIINQELVFRGKNIVA